MNMLTGCYAFLLLVGITRSQTPECKQDDVQYTYTECDSKQERWRVAVPKAGSQCRVVTPSDPPVRGPRCDKSCPAGQYLDVAKDQECKSCPVGTYAVGNGVRYDLWDKLPRDMAFRSHSLFSVGRGEKNCSQQTWFLRGRYLEGVFSDCGSDLILTADLIKPGAITVKYSNTDRALFCLLQVKSLCQSSSPMDGTVMLKQTRGAEYESKTVEMQPGKNSITFSLLGRTHTAPGVKLSIQSIEITGKAFASECTKCEPGYYSSSGSSFCTACAENTYSSESGASICSECDSNHYSSIGSRVCKRRPPCTTNDYYKSIAACENGTTNEVYRWLSPKFCDDQNDTSVVLPPPGDSRLCPPCNPGQALNQHTGSCDYCPDGTFSDGSKQCAPCPLQTVARKTISFTRFNEIPDRIATGCIETLNSGGDSTYCDRQTTWIPRGDFIQVGADVHDEAFSVLNINISGFSTLPIDGGHVYSTFTFRFDLMCEKDDPCLLYLMQKDELDMHPITSWNATTLTTESFVYNFTAPNIRVISLAFVKSLLPSAGAESKSKNTVKVYEISITNTLHGGAAECAECALGGSKNGCHSCKAGEIIVTNNATSVKSCKRCPPNHVVVDSFTCKPCGYGLRSNNEHSSCVSDCGYESPDGMVFDFSPLAGSQAFDGINMFTTEGTSYHHAFNFVLCWDSKAKSVLATCTNNASEPYYRDNFEFVSSLICRETILPAETVISIQPTSLGDRLTNITTNDVKERKRLTTEGGVVLDDDELTIHYRYETVQSTEHCPRGLTTVITLICDTREARNGTMSLPPKCIGGTCDGCHYQLVWRTELACPKCAESDYEKIVGECVHGTQRVHYLPHRYCPMTGELKSKKSTHSCTLLALEMKIAIVSAAVVGLLLFTCALCCWKRSKKLEYKYMRLVEGAQGGGGELPAAQTCAWSEDDEEDNDASDTVHFKTKGDRLFGKLGSNGKGGDGFEKMKLVGSTLPEL